MFGGVEDALRLHTGEIVIVEEFDFEFRVFGSDGGFRRAFGRMGEGPGEFKAVTERFFHMVRAAKVPPPDLNLTRLYGAPAGCSSWRSRRTTPLW